MLGVFTPQGDGQAVAAGAKAITDGFGEGEKGVESVVRVGADRPEEYRVRLLTERVDGKRGVRTELPLRCPVEDSL